MDSGQALRFHLFKSQTSRQWLNDDDVGNLPAVIMTSLVRQGFLLFAIPFSHG